MGANAAGCEREGGKKGVQRQKQMLVMSQHPQQNKDNGAKHYSNNCKQQGSWGEDTNNTAETYTEQTTEYTHEQTADSGEI